MRVSTAQVSTASLAEVSTVERSTRTRVPPGPRSRVMQIHFYRVVLRFCPSTCPRRALTASLKEFVTARLLSLDLARDRSVTKFLHRTAAPWCERSSITLLCPCRRFLPAVAAVPVNFERPGCCASAPLLAFVRIGLFPARRMRLAPHASHASHASMLPHHSADGSARIALARAENYKNHLR